MTRELKRELLLQAARRANREATHGPAYLQSGRSFISELHEQHRFRRLADQTSSSPAEK